MSAKGIIDSLALDTQVFVASGFCFETKQFEALKKLIAAGRLNIVMTDITIEEVRSRIRRSVSEQLLNHRQFINKSPALHNSSLPELKTIMTKLEDETVIQNICGRFDNFIKDTNATVIPATALTADAVFEKYFKGAAPFGERQNKKSEFPDAFVIQTLGEWAEDHNSEMFVVSDDALFRKGCESFTCLHPHPTLAKVLDEVSSDDEHLAAFLRQETLAHLHEIIKMASQQFEELGFWVEDEWGEADVQVTALSRTGDPEILEIEKDEAVVQINFDCSYDAHLSYDDSATATYDEGELMYVEHRDEDVQRKEELEVEVRIGFDHKDLDSVDIIDVSLIDPSQGFGIETTSNYDWPYK